MRGKDNFFGFNYYSAKKDEHRETYIRRWGSKKTITSSILSATKPELYVNVECDE